MSGLGQRRRSAKRQRFGALFGSLRGRFLLVFLAMLLPIILVQVLIYRDRFARRYGEELRTNLEIARTLSQAFQAYLLDIRHQAQVMGLAIAQTPPMLNITAYLVANAATMPSVEAFMLAEPSGRVRAASTPQFEGLNLFELAGTSLAADQDWLLSPLIANPTTGQPAFLIAQAIRPRTAGETVAIVAAIVNADQVEQQLSLDRPRIQVAAIFDNNGFFVLHSPEQVWTWQTRQVDPNQLPQLGPALAGQEAVGEGISPFTGNPILVSMTPIQDTPGWVAGAARDRREALQPILDDLLLHGLLFLVLATLGLLLASFFARRITGPIQQLRQQAARLTTSQELPTQGLRTSITELCALEQSLQLMTQTLLGREAAAQRLAEQAEAARASLQASEERYRLLFQNMNELAIILEPVVGDDGSLQDLIYRDVNAQRFAEITGVSAEAALGQPLRSVFPMSEEYAKHLHDQFDGVAKGERARFELHFPPLQRWFLISAYRLDPSNLVALCADITDQKAAQQAEEVQRRKLEAVLQALPVGVFIADRNGEVTQINAMVSQIWRGTAPLASAIEHYNQYKGWWADSGAPVQTEEWAIARALTHGETSLGEVIDIQCFDGSRATILNSAAPIHAADGSIIGAVAVNEDITSLRRIERELHQLNQELESRVQQRAAEAAEGNRILHAMLTYVRIGIAIADAPDVRIRMVSDYGKRLMIHPAAPAASTTATAPPPPQWGLYHLDGTPATPAELPLTRAVRTGEVVVDQEWLLRRADHPDTVILCNAGPIRDAATHQVTGGVITWSDISHLKNLERELESKNLALNRSLDSLRQRTRDLEEFNKIASHDLQEPLRKIQLFADLLVRHFAASLGQDGSDRLHRLKETAARMQQLIAALRNFGIVSQAKPNLQPVDLNRLVEEVLSDLEPGIAEANASIEVGELPIITADPFQLRQLMQNLIANSLKFRNVDQPPHIQIRYIGNQQPADAPADLQTVHWCHIEVQDNGIGLDPAYSEKIFEPFQRLHSTEAYSGTGMGLAICRKIVENHFGRIRAFSKPGAGTTLRITLPCGLSPELLDKLAV